MKTFLNKTILTAKKQLLRGKHPHEVDIYLRTRRFMFAQKYPGEDDRFLHVIQQHFGSFDRRPLPIP